MQSNSAYVNKPGRPALPPRPYPPNTTYRSSIVVPIARAQPPPPPLSSKSPSPTPDADDRSMEVTITGKAELLLLSSSSIGPATASTDALPGIVNAVDTLSLHSPPQPSSPTSVQRIVLNVSHAASDADEDEEEEDAVIDSPDDTVHIVCDDEDDAAADDEGDDEDDDDDDDASSTIAVRGVPPGTADWQPSIVDGSRELQLPGPTQPVAASVRYAATASSVSASASPMHQQRHQMRNRSLNGSSSLVDGLPDGYDDDDDVRIFQCEHSSNTNGSNGGRRQVDRAEATPTSFTLSRFLEHEAPQAQQQQQLQSIGDPVLVVPASPPPQLHQLQQHQHAHQPQSQHRHHVHQHHRLQQSQPQQPSPPPPLDCSPNNATSSSAVNAQLHQLFAQLGTHHHPAQTARTLYDLSLAPDACAAMRRARCIPLCVQIIHAVEADPHTRRAARRALQNIVNAAQVEALAGGSIGADEARRARREARVLRHIEHVLDYCDDLKLMLYDRGGGNAAVSADDRDRHPLQAMSTLMKLSCSDEEHRQTMSQLGALQAIASIVHYDHAMHDERGPGGRRPDDRCLALRRFAASTLTNLTFGDDTNKSILRANMHFMRSLVGQLTDGVDDQLPANVLRNLSWRADAHMKQVLHEIGAVTALTRAVMRNAHAEPTIMALLPPLWNLSAHSSSNRAEICALDGAIAFLAELLVYVGPSRTWTVMENAGGILRNVSSHIAVNAEYRAQLRSQNGLGTLLQQLAADSETIVSNACGTLWNLSARGEEDQRFLLDSGAVQRLSRLVESGNEMIVNMSSKALKNLLNCGVMPTPVPAPQRTAEYEAAVQRALRVRRALAEAGGLADGRKQPEETEFAPYLGVGGTLEADDGAADGDEMLPPLRITAKTAQMLQNGFMQQQRKYYPPAMLSNAGQSPHQQQQQPPPPPPPPRRSMTLHRDMPMQLPMPTPPAPPRRNLGMHQHQQKLLHQQHQQQITGHSSTSSTGAEATAPYQETDLDQITDFSLRYGGDADAMCQPSQRTHTVRPPPLPPTRRHIHEVSAAAATAAVPEPESLEAPEQCTNYAEEGTPGMYESYSSLDGSLNGDAAGRPAEEVDDEVPVTYRHIEEEDDEEAAQRRAHHDDSDRVRHLMQLDGHDLHCRDRIGGADDRVAAADAIASDSEEQRDQFPPLLQESFAPSGRTSPGGSSTRGGGPAAYDTPMMFSRHSSMGSLSSVEVLVQIGDDGQLVSDYSRLASGAISPSDIPDSPSQMGAQSPRRQSGGAFPFNAMLDRHQQHMAHQQQQQQHPQQPHPLRSVFADDMNAFGVENTPALISCATSLSNLSIDDDPADSNAAAHLLLGRFGQNGPTAAVAAESMHLSSDDDDSLVGDDDDENGDQMLAACIQIGMKRTTPAPTFAAKPEPPIDEEVRTSWQTIASTLDHAHPNAEVDSGGGQLSPLFMDSDDDGGIDGKMERLKKTIQPEATTAADRIGSCSSLSPASPDSTDSSGPGTSSILELCIQSGMHKRPASSASTVVAVATATHGHQREAAAAAAPLSPSTEEDSDLSDDGSGDASDLLAACINMGMKKQASTATATVAPSVNPPSVPQPVTAAAPHAVQRDANHNGWASDISTDGGDSHDANSNDDATDVLLMQQCIRQGMQRKADGQSARAPVERLQQQQPQPAPTADKINVVADISSSDDSDDDGDGMDSILQQAIAIGSKGAGQLKSTTSLSAPSAPTPSNGRAGAYGSNSTTDDDEDDGLAQCIRLGMNKRATNHPTAVLPASHPAHRAAAQTTLPQPPRGLQSASTTLSRPPRAAQSPQLPASQTQQQQQQQQQTLRFNAVAQAERERHMERERQRQRERQLQLERDSNSPAGQHNSQQQQQERLDKDLLLNSIQASMSSRKSAAGFGGFAGCTSTGGSRPNRDQPPPMTAPHTHLHYQQQHPLTYQHHSLPYQTHHSHQPSGHATVQLQPAFPKNTTVASGWPPLAEYGCGCCTVGRYRCAQHGGIVGGSLRRRRDDPLPPIPVDGTAHEGATTAALTSASPGARRQRRVKKRSSSTSMMVRQQQQMQQYPPVSKLSSTPIVLPSGGPPPAPQRNWI